MPTLYIYVLNAIERRLPGTSDAHVVIAESELAAREMCSFYGEDCSWVDPVKTACFKLGKAYKGSKPSTVCTSFSAG